MGCNTQIPNAEPFSADRRKKPGPGAPALAAAAKRALLPAMPMIALILLGFCQGLLFCWAAAEDLRQRETALQSEGSWILLLYCTLVQAACTGYLLTFHGDWALSYWLSASALPGGVGAALCLMSGAAPFLGWLVASPLAKQRRTGPMLYIAAGALSVVVVGVLLTLRRLLVVGSTVEFHNEFGIRSIAGSALGYSLLWMAAIVGTATLWTMGALKRLHLRVGDPTITPGRLK